MKAHIVLAHPEAKSFNARLSGISQRVLGAAGWQHTLSDLYAMDFDRTLTNPAFLSQVKKVHRTHQSEIQLWIVSAHGCHDVIRAFLKKHRFFGMIIPKEYGGLGFSAMAHRAVLQKISSVCAVASSTVAVPNSLGPGELLLHYGTEEQKNHHLPRLARGEEPKLSAGRAS